jgi:allantoinase
MERVVISPMPKPSGQRSGAPDETRKEVLDQREDTKGQSMRLTIRNGTIATASGTYRADIVCDDGYISSIKISGSVRPGDEDIDASDLLVFAGFIDPHVHSRDPGLTEKEDFAHSTAAAAAGGLTTILEMPNAVPPVTDERTLRTRADQHSKVAYVDFGLWGMSLGTQNLNELAALLDAGAIGIKLFWGYALDKVTKELVYNLGDKSPDELFYPPKLGEVLDLFAVVASEGGLLAAHCEDREVIEGYERALGSEVGAYADLLERRPDSAEAVSISLAIEFSRSTGCRFHVVHMASSRAVRLVRAAQRDGIAISAETCPHYLTLTDQSFEKLGPLMKVYPLIRRAEDQRALREAIVDGTIASVGSDHAPHTIEQKRQPLAEGPAGFLGVETIVRLMLNEAAESRIPVKRIAWVLGEGTARLYGLYPRKGVILPGADADFTIVDPERSWTIRNEDLHSKNPLSPWHGWSGKWMPVWGVLRGRPIMRNGDVVGEPSGRWVRSSRSVAGTASVPKGAHDATRGIPRPIKGANNDPLN